MSEPIELTEAEREAAAEAAFISHELQIRGDGRHQPWPDAVYSHDKWRRVVYSVVVAINRVREGDAVGTIRRNDDGDIAVRTNYLNDPKHLAWRIYTHHYLGQNQRKAPLASEQWIGPAGECDWPVVYRPGGDT